LATLVLHNARKSFQKKAILKDVSMRVETGNILGLYGRNGSGKSTLLKLLFGNVKANSILLEINGGKVNSSKVIKEKWIGYLPQHSFLPKNAKVRDLILMFHSDEKDQDCLFYDPHIATMTSKHVGELSLGEVKYLEVVLLSYLPHPFLLLDEPFSMVDPLHKDLLKKHLQGLKGRKGIIITDHYYQDVLEISNQNMILVAGVCIEVTGENDLKKYKYLSR
jgi:ABC-type multidrug transport system ATPase subunit